MKKVSKQLMAFYTAQAELAFVIIVLFFAGLAFSFKVMLPVFFGFMHGGSVK